MLTLDAFAKPHKRVGSQPKQHKLVIFPIMFKVYPQAHLPSSSSQKILTIWMKSLVMNGNGCAVYDSNGQIVYRVDNYACRCNDEVYLMDHDGKTLTKIQRRKLRVFGRWEGFLCDKSIEEEREPWFRVQKFCRIFNSNRPYEARVTVKSGSDDLTCYKILGSACKAEYKIMDIAGQLVAEVKRKLTSSGVALGDDVLTLVMEPNEDELLIMGLMIVCGLINHSM